MTRTSPALRRLGISAVAALTVGAGLPLVLSSAATAAIEPGGSADAPGQVMQAQASATPTATMSPSATPTATMSPSATPTATMSPTASPTATRSPGGGNGNQPSTPPGCARAAEVMLERETITATGSSGVAVKASPNSFVELSAYTRPSTTFKVVRSGTTDNNGNITFAAIKPPANTRLAAQQRGCAFGASKVLNVRTQLSMNVVRNGPRAYTFSGSAIPARPNGLIVSLYRVTPDGRQILTSQTRANANVGQPGYDASRPAGSYTIKRKFTGSGRFGFVVRTGQDLQNAPGSSNIRSLLVF